MWRCLPACLTHNAAFGGGVPANIHFQEIGIENQRLAGILDGEVVQRDPVAFLL